MADESRDGSRAKPRLPPPQANIVAMREWWPTPTEDMVGLLDSMSLVRQDTHMAVMQDIRRAAHEIGLSLFDLHERLDFISGRLPPPQLDPHFLPQPATFEHQTESLRQPATGANQPTNTDFDFEVLTPASFANTESTSHPTITTPAAGHNAGALPYPILPPSTSHTLPTPSPAFTQARTRNTRTKTDVATSDELDTVEEESLLILQTALDECVNGVPALALLRQTHGWTKLPRSEVRISLAGLKLETRRGLVKTWCKGVEHTFPQLLALFVVSDTGKKGAMRKLETVYEQTMVVLHDGIVEETPGE
nr:hypothetical protein B0A51_11797 [Rachicladosporium sp. CCFEE 5018]